MAETLKSAALVAAVVFVGLYLVSRYGNLQV